MNFTILPLLLAFFLASNCQSLSTTKKPLLRRIRSAILPFTLPWYENGLAFNCTSCGKCCKVDGDVWLAPEEVGSIMNYLGYDSDPFSESARQFKSKYVKAEVASGDGDASQSWLCLKRNNGACVFLDPIGKCSIYEVRPVQCSTYPFWPSLLESKKDWEDEAVVPDDASLGDGDRYWTEELGGCEGIISDNAQCPNGGANAEEVPIVDRKEIKAKMRAAKKHWSRFPVDEIKESTWYL